MQKNGLTRRLFLGVSLTATALVTLPGRLIAQVMRRQVGRMQEVAGDVTINENAARAGDPVYNGDTIKVGSASRAMVVFGYTAAAMIKSLTVVKVEMSAADESGAPDPIRSVIQSGDVLQYIVPGQPYSVATPAAVAGVRGTTFFSRAEADRTYICDCHGDVIITSTKDPAKVEELSTDRHAARWVTNTPDGVKIEHGELLYHSDEDILELWDAFSAATGAQIQDEPGVKHYKELREKKNPDEALDDS